MAHVRPTRVLVVRPERAAEVVSPAYDALSPAERLSFRIQHPLSYLNVTQSPDPDSTHDERAALLEASRQALTRLLDTDVFTDPGQPIYGIYQLEIGDHIQTGLVADIAVSDLVDRTVRPHENTQNARAELLASHLRVVGAQSSPIALTYQGRDPIAPSLAELTSGPPFLELHTDDGLTQRVWLITDLDAVDPIIEALADHPLYLLDGHHRARASMVRAAETGDTDTGILGVIFPTRELRLLEYNRWVSDLGGYRVETILADLTVRMGLEPVADPMAPETPGDLLVYAEGQWYGARLPVDVISMSAASALASLDPVVLQREVLEPCFAINDPSASDRLHYLPGGHSLAELAAPVDEHGGMLFVLAPVRFSDMQLIADAGLVLPPKSTYFDPKVRSGLFVRWAEDRG
ncbi:MAG: DUF1015 domain-containing protein [Acidimicrobiales bacterium]|nr:DUF1015 domain-containing protein [Acidimicrobiales bacterium]